MQLFKFTHLVAIALGALHVSAGPASANSTLTRRATAIRVGELNDGSTVAWVAGVSQCDASVVKQGVW